MPASRRRVAGTLARMPRRRPSLTAEERARLLDRRVHRAGSTTEEFAGRERELARSAERAAGRLATTLALLERELGGLAGRRVLELGADPWLFTQLLLERGCSVISAGRRPGVWVEDASPRSPQTVELAWGGRVERVDHHLFDVERDRWPFASASLDVVVCMEVLEHLVYSPAHLLFEACRVLVPGGTLLLTTPNALAARKLALLARGRSTGHPYSGYGWHGRHNREATPAELETLLRAAGFAARIEAVNLAGYEADEPLGRALRALSGLPGRRAARRRDHLIAIARRVGEPRLAFPAGLYESIDRDRMRRQGVLLLDELAPEALDRDRG